MSVLYSKPLRSVSPRALLLSSLSSVPFLPSFPFSALSPLSRQASNSWTEAILLRQLAHQQGVQVHTTMPGPQSSFRTQCYWYFVN